MLIYSDTQDLPHWSLKGIKIVNFRRYSGQTDGSGPAEYRCDKRDMFGKRVYSFALPQDNIFRSVKPLSDL